MISKIKTQNVNSIHGERKYRNTYEGFLDSLRYEDERLATFIDWVDIVDAKELAKNGFYYLRIKDYTSCVFCRGVIGDWELTDIPSQEHAKHFPSCNFLRGEAVGNIPSYLGKVIERFSVENTSQDVCMVENYKKSLFEKLQGGINTKGLPRCTEFIPFKRRLQSFSSWWWPSAKIHQKPQDLAEAGFFYCGISDNVRCFYCGNGLRNWEENDIPWNEHAFWYPECKYVLIKKGKNFVDNIIKKRLSETSSSSVGLSDIHTLTEQELDDLMDLDIPKKAISKFQYSFHIVREALRRILEQTGRPFFTIDSCLEAAIQFMEDKARGFI